MDDLLCLTNLSFRYGSDHSFILDEVNLSIGAGECHCINGPTGSGKSTLLNVIMGTLFRPYEGQILASEGLAIGLVMQDPHAQFIRQSVGAEVAFALENLAVPSELMLDKVQCALRRVGLFVSLDTSIETLSLGQKYRLMIAAQLVFNPNILLLDEPWAQLDDLGVSELISVLQGLKSTGVSIILVEHNPDVFSDLVDQFWLLDKGKLESGRSKQDSIQFAYSPACQIGKSYLEIEPLSYQFANHEPLFVCSEHLQLFSGEIVALVGDNGTGKSSLLKSLAGMQPQSSALPLSVLGRKPKLGIYGSELGLLFQRPCRQLFEMTVLEELQFSLKRFDLPLENADQALQEMDLKHLSSHSPHTLSYGQQHLVALASISAYRPKVLLLDDPFAGLDQLYTCRVWQQLIALSQRGTAILLTSHRRLPHTPVSRYWNLKNGELLAERPTMDALHVG